MMPVFAVSGMEQFLTQAGANGWTVLGAVGSEAAGKENSKEEFKHDVIRESDKVGKSLKKTVLDCHQYSVEGPTVVVLGQKNYIQYFEINIT